MSEIIDCTFEKHAEAILEIFNHTIATSTALYDTEPRSLAFMKSWFANKEQKSIPVIGIESSTGDLIGFASFGPFRPHAAYRNSIEHSLYVKSEYARQGFGRKLLNAIIERARGQNYHLMIGVIDSDNAGSIALHKNSGFTFAGKLEEVGYKFDRWLNVDFYQLKL